MGKRNKFLSTILLPEILALMAISLSHADNRVTSGAFATTAAGTTAGYTIAGTAVMARRGDTITYVTTHVTGLKPGATYGTHVHNLPCNVTGGGGHYKINPADTTTQASNEIWPLLSTDTSGTANAFVTVPGKVRPEGQSIVIHDTTAAKGRIACADLIESLTGAVTTSGAFMKFADTASTLVGTASMVRDGDSTVASITVSGLLATTAYGCHVHNLPGSVQKGGGHYQNDPTNTVASDTNEIWLNFTTDAMGMATKTVTWHHMARPEAQSIVIHAPGGTRIGWADLLPPASTSLTSSAIISGPVVTTAVGTTAGYTNLTGQGLIVRANGRTVAAVKVSGLVKNSAYGSHVHNLPCAQSFGGGHYKIDAAITTAVESNEIWTLLKTDTAGVATGFGLAPTHLAGPTAQSIVVHDTGAAGARIVCIDLMDATSSIKFAPAVSGEPNSMADLGFNKFRIQTEGAFFIRLYNLQGKRILAQSGAGSQILDLAGMAKGHYFLRVAFHANSRAPITMDVFIK